MKALIAIALLLAAAPSADEEETVEPAGSEGDSDELPTVTGARGPLLAEARRELAAMKASRYVHHTRIDEAAGPFDFDCSGFVSYALAHAAPDAYPELRAFAKRRPLASDFVNWGDQKGASKHWARVDSVAALEPGDVVAWLKPADVVSRNTGHVMIVEEPARRRADGEWELAIIDSSAAFHGKRDLRKQLGTTGLGRGVVVLSVNDSGEATGYRWSTWAKSKLHSTRIVLLRAL